MVALPQVMQSVNILVDGDSHLGVATMFVPPVVETDNEEIKIGGMDAPIEHDKGMKALNGSFKLAEFNPGVLGRFGISERQRITFRTSAERLGDSQDVTPIIGVIEGTFKKVELGEFGESKKAEITFEFNAFYYKLTVGSEEIYEIDIANVIRRIRGVDKLAKRRAALGI